MIVRAMLGPQRLSPTVGPLLDQLGIADASVCSVTAGWQEREGELGELQEHLGRRTVDLGLYHRAEEVFAADPEFRRAYRQRQKMLKELQRLYRRRLAHANAAYAEMMREPGADMLLQNERRAALRALRTLDRQHLRRIDRIHATFQRAVRPDSHAGIQSHRREIEAIIAGSQVVLIAGGHVQVLLNRLRLFGISPLIADRTLVAWSAGAMALADEVVLFHDHPPQGAGIAEVADRGLGLFPGLVPLPHAGQRLRLEDSQRVSLFARRFAPARSVTLDAGASLLWRDDHLAECASTFRLMRQGGLRPMRLT
jgi:peptidase E